MELIRLAKLSGTVEVVRSFSYKLNAGNYESRDFFCSQKAQCQAEDAEQIAEVLHAFCKHQVMNAVREYQREMAPISRKGAA